MKTTSIYFIIVVCGFLNAQVETRDPNIIEIPQFYVDALSFSTDDSLSSREDIYVQIPYDALQFIKTGDQYRSRFDITATIVKDDNALISEKYWSEEVRLDNFDETQSNKAYSLTQRSVVVPPGTYVLRVQLRDDESKKITTVEKKINVSSYGGKDLSISDILLVNKVSTDGDRRNIVPNISGKLVDNNGIFFLFYEIYALSFPDSLKIHYSVLDGNENILTNIDQLSIVKSFRSQMIVRFDSLQLPTGKYAISIDINPYTKKTGNQFQVKQKVFSVRSDKLPLSINDLDLAIRQLRYIAHDQEYENLINAKTEVEKRRLFDEFWRRRDRNPDTKKNEFMEEYYNRVEYANEHFSHFLPGWKTDMGMVFILAGSPNSVERHPFDIDSKPYEVWSYYDFNKQVVFIDDTGFGDYRLLTPIWDILQQLKY